MWRPPQQLVYFPNLPGDLWEVSLDEINNIYIYILLYLKDYINTFILNLFNTTRVEAIIFIYDYIHQ